MSLHLSSIASTGSCRTSAATTERGSATDFLLHDLAPIIDRLADDYESSTIEVPGAPGVRVLLAGGTLVPFIAVYATLAEDDGVDIIDVGLDRRDP